MRVSILTVFVLLLGFTLYQTIDGSGPLKEGDPAPDFTLQTLEGDTVQLSDLKGQPVLINFWATYCGPCRDEMPAIERRYDKYKDTGFQVLAVNTGESELSMRTFLRSLDLSFPTLLDPKTQVTNEYNVTSLPHSFFIHPDGTINKVVIGPMTDTIIEQHLRDILPETSDI